MFISLYKKLMTLMFPLLKVTYIKKRQKNGKEHALRFNERLGIYHTPRPEGRLYWLHGASVGEAISMLPLIDKLLKEDSELTIMVTTGTLTSAEIMAKRLPERAFHQFIPFDVPQFAKQLLAHFKPDAVLWFESELWPSLLSEIHEAKVPLILVNGRISDHSFKNWRKVKFISKELMGCFSLCLGQSELDKERLEILGAKKTAYYGNLKYAGMPLPVDEEKLKELQYAIGKRPVFLISSTHHNEEEQLASQLRKLYENIPDVLTIVVPRHPHRGMEVVEMFKNKGFRTCLRSAGEGVSETTEVYVADTIGEMGLWYKLAEISFIGGSLVRHGGQNFMEAARDKNAIIFGQYMFNFKDMVMRAKNAGAVCQLEAPEEIIYQVIEWFKKPQELERMQQAAYNWTVKEATVLDGIADVLQKELNV